MGLFDTRKRLEALEQEVQRGPTPVNMVSLIEKYMAVGEEAKALDWARQAVEKFPDSEKCSATYENIQKLRLQHQIVQLNQTIRRNPSIEPYEQLATLYLQDLGNRNKAYELALEGLNKFPRSDGLHLICGQVRMERFHSDFLANDFMEAVRHFETAAEVNPANGRAHLNLGRLYAEAGAYDRGKTELDSLVRLGELDANSDRLHRLVGARAPQSVDLDEALQQIELRRGLTAEGLELRKIFEPSPRGGTILQVSAVKIEGFLARFGTMPGYRASAVVAGGGEALATHTTGKVAKDRFVQLVQAIVRCCEEASRRMDIGAFVHAEIETNMGRVSIASWKNMVIGILADVPAKKGEVDAAIEKFVEFLSVG